MTAICLSIALKIADFDGGSCGRNFSMSSPVVAWPSMDDSQAIKFRISVSSSSSSPDGSARGTWTRSLVSESLGSWLAASSWTESLRVIILERSSPDDSIDFVRLIGLELRRAAPSNATPESTELEDRWGKQHLTVFKINNPGLVTINLILIVNVWEINN